MALHRGLPGGFLGVEVDASFGGVADLDHGHDVQCSVDAPVAGAGEPMPGLLAGGGIQRGGAVPGGERVAVGEPVDVADVGEQPSRTGGADPGEFHQGGPAGRDQLPPLVVDRLGLLVDSLQLDD